MRRYLLLFVLAVSSAVLIFADTEMTFSDVQLVRVYDGDTIFVNIPGLHPLIGQDIGIRVRGIDTPEIRGKCQEEKEMALTAKSLAEDTLLGARRIDIIDAERGKYFRILAAVTADGVSLGALLIDAGLAVHYNGKGPRHNWCG